MLNLILVLAHRDEIDSYVEEFYFIEKIRQQENGVLFSCFVFKQILLLNILIRATKYPDSKILQAVHCTAIASEFEYIESHLGMSYNCIVKIMKATPDQR